LRFSVAAICNGVLAGLVSITAACDGTTGYGALIVGFLGGLIYNIVSYILLKLEIDDPLDAFPIHGATGIWGVLAVGIFHTEHGFLYGDNGKRFGY
jgi:Amt family ammonium transporter